jgi:hypothetical protein
MLVLVRQALDAIVMNLVTTLAQRFEILLAVVVTVFVAVVDTEILRRAAALASRFFEPAISLYASLPRRVALAADAARLTRFFSQTPVVTHAAAGSGNADLDQPPRWPLKFFGTNLASELEPRLLVVWRVAFIERFAPASHLPIIDASC